ncbi:MAG: ribokinase [Clostridia bacterium]|nr:ribokinase [Clostridia bacterium]
MAKITVIGSLNMDLVVTTPRVPAMGETILGSAFMTAPGGKGANQAVAAARLGGDVTMVGCVGNDIFGRNLLENLEMNNVNTEYVRTLHGYPTGVAIIVIKDGNNCIIVDPGANGQLKPADMEGMESLIKDSFIVVIQLEIPLDTVESAIRIAKKHNVKVLLNPAPAAKLSDELLSMVDVFTPNESECEIITGLPAKTTEEAKKAVAYLNSKGIETVIVTLGGKGVVYNSGNEVIHKPVPEVKVVDTTAAGDSFSGALAVSLARGEDIDTAIDFANIVGTLTVTKKGAQTSLPTLHDVEMFRA